LVLDYFEDIRRHNRIEPRDPWIGSFEFSNRIFFIYKGIIFEALLLSNKKNNTEKRELEARSMVEIPYPEGA